MEFLTAGESVDRMASYCRVEQLLFGLLGRWVVDVSEPSAKLTLVATADHCAWRSRRWFEMLPTAAPGPDAFMEPTDIEHEVFTLVAELAGSSQGAQMVLAYEELLPALRGAMIEHLERTTAVADVFASMQIFVPRVATVRLFVLSSPTFRTGIVGRNRGSSKRFSKHAL